MGAMRRIIASAVPLAAAALACVGSQAANASHAKAARAAITKVQGVTFAHEVNLLAGDVPGAKATAKEHEQGREGQASVEFAHCAGGVNPNLAVANIDSATFEFAGDDPTAIFSSAVVMPSAAQAARNYAAIESKRGRRCLARLLPKGLESNGPAGRVRVKHATVSILKNPLPSGEASFGARATVTLIATTVTGKQITAEAYTDVYEILAGPAEVTLTSSRVSQPPSAAEDRHLLSLLYGRAKAHEL